MPPKTCYIGPLHENQITGELEPSNLHVFKGKKIAVSVGWLGGESLQMPEVQATPLPWG